MCKAHKGFRGFRALLPASILGGNLIDLKHAIPYEIIHSPLTNQNYPNKYADRCFIQKMLTFYTIQINILIFQV
jgi:hypothetical protein